MSRKLPALCALLLMSQAAWAQSVEGLAKGEDLPTLYELTAHSSLVVSASVVSGQVKLAQVQVEEVFRGDGRAGQRLQIAFRDLNLDLDKENRVVFADGEMVILFLEPEVNWEGVRKGEDRYSLYRGRFGKVTLPREGSEIYLEALRVFSSMASQKDHRKLYAQIRGLLGSPNPILADAGLKETLRLDLMDRSLLPVVLSYLQDPSPGRRSQALKLLEGLFRNLKEEEYTEEDLADALSRVLALARNDPSEAVRVAAVEALGSWSGEEVLPTLEAVATQDPAQGVRFQAKVILLKRNQAGKKNSKPTHDGSQP
jgi:HEAT repeat protein